MRTVAILVGAMAGFGTAVGNAAGPIMGIYLIMMGLDKKQLWVRRLVFLIIITSKLPIFIDHEMIGIDVPHFLNFYYFYISTSP